MPQRLHGRLTRAALIGLALDVALGAAMHPFWRRLLLPPGAAEILITLPGWQPTALAYSPSRPLLAIGLRRQSPSPRGGVALIDTASGALRTIVSDLPDGIAALAFSPDGAQLALATDSGQILLRSNEGGPAKASRILDTHFLARTLAFSPDGQWLAVAGPGDAGLFSLRGGPVHRLPGPATALAFSPDSRWLVVGTPPGGFRKVNLGKGHLSVLSPLANAATFSPDGRFLALIQEDRIEMRSAGGRRAGPWERRLGVQGHHLEVDEAPGSAVLWSQYATAQEKTIAFSPDSAWLLCGERNQVSFLRVTDGEIHRRQFVFGFTGVLASAPHGEGIALCRQESVILWPDAYRL